MIRDMYTVDKEDKKRALEYAEELLDEPDSGGFAVVEGHQA